MAPNPPRSSPGSLQAASLVPTRPLARTGPDLSVSRALGTAPEDEGSGQAPLSLSHPLPCPGAREVPGAQPSPAQPVCAAAEEE